MKTTKAGRDLCRSDMRGMWHRVGTEFLGNLLDEADALSAALAAKAQADLCIAGHKNQEAADAHRIATLEIQLETERETTANGRREYAALKEQWQAALAAKEAAERERDELIGKDQARALKHIELARMASDWMARAERLERTLREIVAREAYSPGEESMQDSARAALNEGFRKCEFCGCVTNAHLRRCCKKGHDADAALAPPAKTSEEAIAGAATTVSPSPSSLPAEAPKSRDSFAPPAKPDAEPKEECGSCRGYGHFSKYGKPSIDKRDRKCLDCAGSGRATTADTPDAEPSVCAAWQSRPSRCTEREPCDHCKAVMARLRGAGEPKGEREP